MTSTNDTATNEANGSGSVRPESGHLEDGSAPGLGSQTESITATEREPERPTDIPRRSWGHVVGRVGKQVKHHNLTDRAATLTYYGLLALFPGLLVVVSLLGFVGHSTTNQIIHNLEQVAPGSVKSFLLTAIRHVQGRARRGHSCRTTGACARRVVRVELYLGVHAGIECDLQRRRRPPGLAKGPYPGRGHCRNHGFTSRQRCCS